MAVAPTYIDPPPPPQVPRGIFDVALGPLDLPEPASAAYGVIYQPDACAPDFQLISMECPAITGSKAFTGIEASVSGTPFTVVTSYTCSPVGIDLAEAERRVRLRMQLREQRAVESRIWSGSSGALGTIPSLFAGAEVVGPASCPTEAIELLEQWLADNGVLGGIIHTRPGMVSHLAASYQFPEATAGKLQTHLGTPFVFGQGYAGTGPTGQVPTDDVEWMYATGRIRIWRGDVQVPPPRMTFDRSANVAYLLAERQYIVTVECGVAAVQVTRNCLTAGSA